MPYLSKKQLETVRGFLPQYTKAMSLVGLGDPLALAALHYRESEFQTRGAPNSGEGPFGCDQGGAGEEAIRRMREYVAKVATKYGYQITIDPIDLDKDFTLALLVAANIFKSKIRGTISITQLPEDVLADAFWGYNGRSSHHNALEQVGSGSPDRTWKFSPYVVNDPQAGVTLKMIATQPDTTVPGGRRTINRVDGRPGALIVYRELKSAIV